MHLYLVHQDIINRKKVLCYAYHAKKENTRVWKANSRVPTATKVFLQTKKELQHAMNVNQGLIPAVQPFDANFVTQALTTTIRGNLRVCSVD